MINGPLDTVKRARKLRSELTLPERLVLQQLRKRPSGLKFRRQHPAGVYVLDFYCAAARLAIEIDGKAHDNAYAARFDERRSEFLRSQRVATLRVPARVMLHDLEVAMSRIVEICLDRIEKMSRLRDVPLHHALHGPAPRVGEVL